MPDNTDVLAALIHAEDAPAPPPPATVSIRINGVVTIELPLPTRSERRHRMRRLAILILLLFTFPAGATPAIPDAKIRAQARAFLLPCHGNAECSAAGQTFVREYLLAMHGSHGNQWMMTDWFSAPTPVPVVALSGRQYCAWLWILVDGVGSHYKDIDLSAQANRCDALPVDGAGAIVWRRYQALRKEIRAVTGHSSDAP